MADTVKVSEIELHYKHPERPSMLPQVTRPHEAYHFLHAHWDENRIEMVEDFKVLLLNRSYRALGVYTMSHGGVNGTVADPKLVFTAALLTNASSIVLAHNHPCGNLHPRLADKKLTEQMKKGGKLLGIDVVDHLIITNEGFYSFKHGVTYGLAEIEPCHEYPNVPLLTL